MTPEEFTAALDELCLTQAVLARLLSVDKSTVNRWAKKTGATGAVEQCMRAWRRKPITLAEALTHYVQDGAGDEAEKQAAARCGWKLTRWLLRT